MRDIVLQPTSTAQWHALVREAEQRAACSLGEEIESYLVILLQRFLGRSEIASVILARDYLKGLTADGKRQYDKLRDVGDICLLHAGFFPRRARRRRVSVSYYIDLGISAYAQLQQNRHHPLGHLFAQLSQGFVPAMDVLQAMQTPDHSQSLLDPLTAHELWEHSGSSQATRHLQSISQGAPFKTPQDTRH